MSELDRKNQSFGHNHTSLIPRYPDPNQASTSRPNMRRACSKNPAPTSRPCLEGNGGTPLLLVTTELEVLASLEGELVLGLADGALETEDNLLGLLGRKYSRKEWTKRVNGQ